jgi:cytochrome P450
VNAPPTSDLQDVARIDDPQFYLDDPRPVYARLRREAPAFWYEHAGVWALSRYPDICNTAKDATEFTLARGAFMGEIPAAAPAGCPLPKHTFRTDPPYHAPFRKVFSPAFTPQAIGELDGAIRRIVGEALDALPDGEAVDFVESMAVPITIGVLAEIMGVPRSDRDDLERWTDAIVAALEVTLAEDERARVAAELDELAAYMDDQLDQRLRHPRDDLLSTLAHATIDGHEVPRAAQIQTCRGLLAAGNDTTRNALSGGIVALAENPDEWQRLRADRTLVSSATDEILRYTSVQLHRMRATTRATVIAGQEIPAGAFVVLLLGSGNFDDAAFPEPERFDIGRPSHPSHLAFSYGPHRCLGAALARQEIRIVLEEMAGRFRGWDVAGDVVRHPSTVVASYDEAPVTFQIA